MGAAYFEAKLPNLGRPDGAGNTLLPAFYKQWAPSGAAYRMLGAFRSIGSALTNTHASPVNEATNCC